MRGDYLFEIPVQKNKKKEEKRKEKGDVYI
jgi:hypothetical protein